jgi:hypothetical protein
MLLYIIIFIYLLLMSIVDFSVRKDRLYDYLYVLFAVFIFFVAGFRAMGNDYDGYEEIFNAIKILSIFDIFDPSKVFVEPLFTILNITLSGFSYQTLLAVMAAINILVLFPFFRKYSPYPYVTLLFFAGMFMYSGIMGSIRQSLAVAICLWAMINYQNKKFWWLLFVATMFHYTAVLVLIVRFLKNGYYTRKTYMVVGVIAIFSNLLLYEIFSKLIVFLPAVVTWKLEIYLATEKDTHFGLNAAVGIRLFTFVLAYIYRDKIAATFPKYAPLFVNIYFLSLILYLGLGFLPQAAVRGSIYFLYVELLVVPMILYVANNINRVWIFTLYMLFSLWRHYEMVTVYAETYMPYKTILFNSL